MKNEKIKKLLGEPICNMCQAFADDFCEANAGQRQKMGIKSQIIRTVMGNCCEWCRQKAGTYDYDSTDRILFQRHDHCKCTLEIKAEKIQYNGMHPKQISAGYKRTRIAQIKEKEENNLPAKRRIANRDAGDIIKLIKLGANFVNKHELLHRNAKAIKKIEGYTDVICHGSPDEFIVYMDKKQNESYIISAEMMAMLIQKSAMYHGGPIRLISCQTGKNKDGIAQRLANELQINILAPTETVNVDEDGRIFLTDNDILAEMWYTAKDDEEKNQFVETGKWVLFRPGG